MANENTANQTLNVTDTAVHPGDSATYNRKLVQESYPYIQNTVSGLLVTGPGIVAGFIVIATNGGVFTVYDSTTAANTKIFDSTGMTLTVGQVIELPYAIQFNFGLYISISGTALTLNTLVDPQ
jgi:aspartate oxidase